MSTRIEDMSDKPIIFSIPKEGETVDAVLPQGVNHVEYLPFGTKTFKIHSVLSEDVREQQLRLILRPRKSYLDTDGQIAGYEDNPTDPEHPELRVTWAGGKNNRDGVFARGDVGKGNACQPITKDQEGYCYFNMTHIASPKDGTPKPRPEPYKFTIQAYNEKNGEYYCGFEIKVKPPGNLSEGSLLHVEKYDNQEDVFCFKGQQIPLYIARWSPTLQVRYDPLPESWKLIQDLKIKDSRKENKVQVFWKDQELPLMEIAGELENHELEVEAFRFFDQKHIVIRLWFFWLKPTDPTVEVPDAERFDLLMDGETGTVKYLGTDLHWREGWFKLRSGGKISAKLGMSNEDSLIDLGRALIEANDKFESAYPHNNPSYYVCEELPRDGKECYHKHLYLKYKGTIWGTVEKMLGYFGIPIHSHAPLVAFEGNVGIVHGSDVREGDICKVG